MGYGQPIGLMIAVALAGLATADPAVAQRAHENAITSADDAFGSLVGDQQVGIYTSDNVRGFSPSKAGNLRIEGVYFDQVAYPNLVIGDVARVGPAALDYPFPAPTGIIDYQVRIPGDQHIFTASVARTPYEGGAYKVEGQGPLIADHLSLWANANSQPVRNAQGAGFDAWNVGLVVRIRHEGGEILGIGGYNQFHHQTKAPIVVASGPFVPDIPSDDRYLGENWAINRNNNSNIGLVIRQQLGQAWSLRGGVWDSHTVTLRNYTEVLALTGSDGSGRHFITSDPRLDARSVSGEAQLAWRNDGQSVHHRILLMLRGRDRTTQSGGSDVRDLGPAILGQPDPTPRPDLKFGPVDTGRIKQLTVAAGYVGRLDGWGQLNLGLQKTDYRATFTHAGLQTAANDKPWLYNAAIVVTPASWLSLFSSYVTGLEDSGVAPDNAANRGQQLPSLRTRQIDGGFRVKRGPFRMVASLFDIEKPYFSFDQVNRFTTVGNVRHRGVEMSVSQEIGGRLDLLAGAVFLDPVVTGQTNGPGMLGKRPVGTTPLLLRLDANYRTPIEGVSLNASVVHTGRRTASAQTFAQLGGSQVEVGSTTTLDVGARYQFNAAGTPMSLRFLLSNVFDSQSWNIVAPSSYLPNNGRGMTLELVADF